ncbi:hypothetical protein [Gordonia rubripertincta]|uniref:Uncharacterized protein n=1 Tax=Gordonia rubripertincta TaxID=36822 RepID=A0ABT4MQW3_GORRU|nr:hypothetical protein [Gordonia rubripertincta]MCZ4549387.1 hypothetical protein [Gordonia rubripertincta]
MIVIAASSTANLMSATSSSEKSARTARVSAMALIIGTWDLSAGTRMFTGASAAPSICITPPITTSVPLQRAEYLAASAAHRS